MTPLLLASLIWAFSFGLIGSQLAGLPSGWCAWIRMALSMLVFLPFARRIPWKTAAALLLTGAIQFGWMYLAYMASFRHLPSHVIALFTITTPLFIAALYDAGTRRFHPRNLLAAALAVAGASLIMWKGMATTLSLWGILLVQISNLCFAIGQLAYRRIMARLPDAPADSRVFFWLYLGGCLALLPLMPQYLRAGAAPHPTAIQWATLLYLGIVASGLCFFLWNHGARRVPAGRLAVMNNLKIPLSVAVSLLIFRETAGWHTLLAGILLFTLAFLPLRRKD